MNVGRISDIGTWMYRSRAKHAYMDVEGRLCLELKVEEQLPSAIRQRTVNSAACRMAFLIRPTNRSFCDTRCKIFFCGGLFQNDNMSVFLDAN